MKSWIYYLIPLLVLIALILVPAMLEKEGTGAPPPAGSAITPAQRAVENVAPASTPRPQPAANPRVQFVDMNYLDLASKEYRPLADGGALPADSYHFNAKLRNTGGESVLVYYDVTQDDGARLLPMGATEWFLPPGQEVYLFVQGANLRPPGRNVQLNFVMKERGSDKVLDQRTLRVTSR
ncbi:MAG: hypothetical protein HY673_22480 [Chloroflexi bacterium]|nr:hypothetical protein [Chloroflexota bacterium]